jgi:hypothetical protein
MLWSGSPPQIVITGLDPVINALSGADGASSAAWMAGSSQIESGHDNYWRIARGDWVGAPRAPFHIDAWSSFRTACQGRFPSETTIAAAPVPARRQGRNEFLIKTTGRAASP